LINGKKQERIHLKKQWQNQEKVSAPKALVKTVNKEYQQMGSAKNHQ
jgi:hypothetical protein